MTDIFSLVRQSIAGTLPGQQNWVDSVTSGGDAAEAARASLPAEVWTPGQRETPSQNWMPSYVDLARELAIATSPTETPGPWLPTDATVFDPSTYDARLVPGSRWVAEGDDPVNGQVYEYYGNGMWGGTPYAWSPPDFTLVPAGYKQFTKGWAAANDIKQYSPAWNEWYARDRHGADTWANYWSKGESAPGEGEVRGCAICGSSGHTTAEHWTPNYQDLVPKFADLSHPGSWRT